MKPSTVPRLAVLTAALLLLPLTACRKAAPPQPRSQLRIGVTMYDQYDTFIDELVGGLIAYAQQVEVEQGLTITIMAEGAQSKQDVQNSQVETFIDAGCDVLCVNLVDRTDAATIIDMAEAAGLPIIFFNRELVEEDLNRNSRLFYVGAVAAESGRLQGQIAAALWEADQQSVDRNGDGVMQYVMLEGEPGHQDAVMRTEYSVGAVSQAGIPLERLEDEIANWMRAQAETKMSQFLERHRDTIEVVFANNDDMALGAIDALKRAQVPFVDWPVILGIDGTLAGLEAVSLGEMSGTVYNDAWGQAVGMLDIAVALCTGGPLPELQDGKYLRLPYLPVTLENVQSFLQ